MVDFRLVYFESTSAPFYSLLKKNKNLINVIVYMDASFRTIPHKTLMLQKKRWRKNEGCGEGDNVREVGKK